MCVFGVCMTEPSAACSAAGSTAECGSGSRCWALEGGDGICWPDCDSYSCVGSCDSDGSCVPVEGMDCDQTCGTYCTGTGGGGGDGGGDGGGGGGTGNIGSACGSDGDCGGAACQPESADNGFIDGYCIDFGCTNPGGACGSGGICVAGLGSDGSNVCMQQCGACRTGYDCLSFSEQTFCYPYCEISSDCPSGYQCQDQVCVDGRPCAPDNPDGVCEDGLSCIDGSCEVECSATSPDGYCPGDYLCTDGVCVSPHGCGTWECSGRNCDDMILLPGSSDPASAQARADGYYLSSPPRYSYLRRDLTMVLQWATCEMRALFPDATPLAIGDLAQSNGLTPGVDAGSPRHPTSTHRGNDLDIAYWQTDGANNYQIICGDGSDTNGNGRSGRYNDGYFCTTESNVVDFEQQTRFLALMATHPGLRVTGVDETLDEEILDEARALLDAGVITRAVYDRLRSLGVGADGGWQFHHHHIHVSYN